MANHLIVIPVFGMTARSIPYIPGGWVVHRITPNWLCKGGWDTIVDEVGSEILLTEKQVREADTDARFVVYGFSIGADILMALINLKFQLRENQRVNLAAGTVPLAGACLILAEPNTREADCFVTTIASGSKDFDEFCVRVNSEINGLSNEAEKKAWKVYLSLLDANGAKAHWSGYKRVAGEIVQHANSRFPESVHKLKDDWKSLGLCNAQMLLSDGCNYVGDEYAWLVRTQEKHFSFLEGVTINKLATELLAKKCC